MKRNTKKLFSLLLALLMVVSLTTTAFAADASITFEGLEEGFAFAPGSQYTATDLFDNFKNVMPGDTLTQTITFTNDADDCDYIKLYMRAVAHDEETNPLTYSEEFEAIDGKDQAGITGERDETVATMTEFLAQLSMQVYIGGQLIYDASPDELDGLAEPVLLGEFRSGDTTTLSVNLNVPIELGNEFANRVGEVDWVFTAEGFDDPEPPECGTWVTVHKIWRGPGPHPLSVKVYLLKDGKRVDAKLLTPLTQWTWTWGGLERGHDWTVEEVVPDGYEAEYYTVGHLTIITNTKIPVDPEPTDPTVPTEPDPTVPTEPDPTVPTEPDPTVPTEPDPTEPTDPDPTEPTDPDPTEPTDPDPTEPTDPDPTEPTDPDPTEPTDPDPTEPTDPDPTEPTDPDPTEPTDPDPTEPTDPDPTVPTEPEEPEEPVDLTVKKKWSGDSDNKKKRPKSVSVTLYDGKEAVETVKLGDWNDWTYTWEDLDGNGDWSVLEVNIPKGYTPSYRTRGNVVTITNTATLIQTGQLNWPIPVLGGLGMLMVFFGIFSMRKKKKNGNA